MTSNLGNLNIQDFAKFLPLVFIMLPMFAGGLLVFHQIKNEWRRHFYIECVTILNSLLVLLAILPSKINIWGLNFNFGLGSYTSKKLVLWHITESLNLALRFDPLARLFTLLIAFIWPLITLYVFGYLKRRPPENRFFAPLLATYGILLGVACSANFLTLYMFFELMTFMTLPIVMHSQRQEAIRGTVMYLFYSVTGAALALCGFFVIHSLGPSSEFTPGGILSAISNGIANDNTLELQIAVFMALIGFGAKAGMFPLHAWLPVAHPVALTPASAALSGLITKGGIIAMIRVAYFIAGPAFLKDTWVQKALLCMALLTIFMGSMMACVEKHLKRRIAWSSVSQVSYVIFAMMLLTPDGLTGALMQAIAHALAKSCLFLSAGVVIYFTWPGVDHHYADQVRGVGKELPITMTCFAIASISLIGLPITGGFTAKWSIMTGALNLNLTGGANTIGLVGVIVLLVSALLTALYLLPIIVMAFFPGDDFDYSTVKVVPLSINMRIPQLLLCAGVILVGALAGPLGSWIQRYIVATITSIL